MTTTMPLIMPSLTPTSSPTRKTNTYNSQNTTPISSFLNSNKTPITPDSCNSSTFTNKLPKIKLILKLPHSSSPPEERSGTKSAPTLIHKPINIPPSVSSASLVNKNSLNSSSQTALMIDEIMNTLFDTTEILLRKSKNSDSSSQRKSRKNSNGSSKSKATKNNVKLRKVRTSASKIKKVPVKASPAKKVVRKKQVLKDSDVESMEVSEEARLPLENSISDINTIVPPSIPEIELRKEEMEMDSSLSSITAVPNEESHLDQILTSTSSSSSSSSSYSSPPKSEQNNDNNDTSESSSNQTFKLKKIKFIYNPENDKSNTKNNEESNENISTDNGKRKRKSGNQKSASPKKKRETLTMTINTNTNTTNSTLSKNLFSNEKESNTSPSNPVIHLKVSNNNDNSEIISTSKSESPKINSDKRKGRKRASPTKRTAKSTKSKKINETILPTNQKSPPQRSPKAQPQTKSYQMSKLDRKNINNNEYSYTSSSSSLSKSTPTFKLNLSYTPSYVNPNDGSRFNSYLSTLKQKPSYVHSPLNRSFTFDEAENSIPATNNYYVPSKLSISSTVDGQNYKVKTTQISPTNQILNNNLWKNKNGSRSSRSSRGITSSSKSKKEKISIIDVLKRESQLFTSSSKKLHSKSSISSYYGKPSRRRYSSFIEEVKVKPISIHSSTSSSSNISTKSIITSQYNNRDDMEIVRKPSNNKINKSKDPAARIKSYSTPASPKSLSEDSLRTKAHNYIQRSLTSCKSLTEKFEFHSILGYGSNGVVLGARRRSDHLDVAIKYIYKTPSSHICEEVNILKEISPHPSIIRYIDSFEDNNCIYLVTEKSGSSWVPSEDSNQVLTCECPVTGRIVLHSTTCNTSSLFDYIELNGCVPPPEQKRMFKAIAEAVYALHSRNIVHGDIKEENILIDSHHNPKLCDFGHARHIGNSSPPHFAVYGTLELSAPELMPNLNVPAHLTKTHVVKRYNGMAQDIWALGLVLYTMTHGELPLNHSKVISKEIDLTSNKYKEYPCSYNRNLSKGKNSNNNNNYNNNNNNNTFPLISIWISL